jgi:decaprenyl-phosphate phosphoribosyltransferase
MATRPATAPRPSAELELPTVELEGASLGFVAAPAPPSPSVPSRLRPGSAATLLRACRPRQWLKSLVVVLPPAAAGVLTRGSALAEVCGAFVVFCLLSSATYLVNDVRDLDSDRRHPRKRFRPIAAGELSPSRALRAAAILAISGVCLALAIRPAFALVAVCYLALTLSYSLIWREVIVADILVVATGFLLRAVGGGVAADVRLSRSFLIVTSACALFLVAGKRYAEAREQGQRATRLTLSRYTTRSLRLLVLGAAATGAIAYAWWVFTRPASGPWIPLSLIPFVLWLGRYTGVLGLGAGEAPEELIFRDRGLLIAGAAWTLLFMLGIYGAR